MRTVMGIGVLHITTISSSELHRDGESRGGDGAGLHDVFFEMRSVGK